MKITSKSFKHKEMIPKKFTCQGSDINPSLDIEEIPQGAKSLVLVMDDPDAPGGVWVHWVMYNIPITKTVEEDSSPGEEVINSFGKKSYGGPCPPSGTHRYYFKIYALDTKLELGKDVNLNDLKKAMQGHILDESQIVGLYKKE
ncbi:MAG: hypothetical protein AMS24_02670 [Chlamydiae bacterium SM23_39]|nr:MAG: hypothetical protein AMS24_02670 [Chlamydiae bacterium SM23_39]